jgi:cytochrome c-type biogenesis protein CcmH/NrfG
MQQPQPTKLSVGWQSLAIVGEKSRRAAPFSEPVGWYHQSLLGYRSRHCYGINFANNGLDRAFMILMGKVLEKKGEFDLAVRALQRAVTMDPNNSITHHLLGQAYRELGRNEDAELELRLAEQLQERESSKQ